MIPRYSRSQMSVLWSEEAKFNAWLKVELAVCEAYARQGKITDKEQALTFAREELAKSAGEA